MKLKTLNLLLSLTLASLGCAAPTEADTPSPEIFSVALQVPTPTDLPKCTSTLAGTTAYVASPAGLWSCVIATAPLQNAFRGVALPPN